MIRNFLRIMGIEGIGSRIKTAYADYAGIYSEDTTHKHPRNPKIRVQSAILSVQSP
jgi:hypothetical protein